MALFAWGVGAVFGPSAPSLADHGAVGGWAPEPGTDVAAAGDLRESATANGADGAAAPRRTSVPDMMGEFLVAMWGNATGRVAAEDDDSVRRELKVRRGDTLMKMLLGAGVPRPQAHEAIVAMRKVHDPRDILPGQQVMLTYRLDGAARDEVYLEGFNVATGVEREIAVFRDEERNFSAEKVKKPLLRRLVRAEGVIDSSLYKAGVEAGMPLPVLAELIRIYSWDVDFQRDIRSGNAFDVVFERLYTAEGEAVGNGDIIYSVLSLGGQPRRLYRFEYSAGRASYFNEKGESARKPLLRTPVDGARLSSRYGRRRHPILGYSGMHRGVDFAAPRGTPIFAGGDGRITHRGRKGAYGRYIRIRHNSRYSTAYAHMYRYRRGLAVGSRVRQGQVIGYVGSSGRSTGAHLHYEILVNGRQTNPLRVKMPAQRRLRGERLADFQASRIATESLIAGLSPVTRIARK